MVLHKQKIWKTEEIVSGRLVAKVIKNDNIYTQKIVKKYKCILKECIICKMVTGKENVLG